MHHPTKPWRRMSRSCCLDLFERVQRRLTKIIRQVAHSTDEKTLKELGLFGLEKDPGSLYCNVSIFKRGYKMRTNVLVGSVVTGQDVIVLN